MSSLTRMVDWLIKCKVMLTGAVERYLDDRLTDFVSITDFGAIGDGVFDNKDVFAKLAASGKTAFLIPEGVFATSDTVSFIGMKVTLKGAGVGASFIKFTNTSINGIYHKPTDHSHYFDFRDFTILPVTAPTKVQSHALLVDGSSQPNPLNLYNGIPTTEHRETKRGSIHNVVVKGDTPIGGFDRGLVVRSLLNYSFTGCSVYGSTNVSDEGYAVDGAGVCVDIRFYDNYAYNVNVGMMLPDYTEGIHFQGYEFVNVNIGILEDYVAGRSTLSADKCGSNAHKIGSGHINAYTHTMFLNASHFIKINGLLLLNNLQNNPALSSGIWLANTNWPSIGDVMFYTPTTRPDNFFGIVLDGVTNGQFARNNFQSYPVGYHLIGACQNNNISDSVEYYGASGVCVNITSPTVLKTRISNCMSDGTDVNDLGTGTRYSLCGIAKQGTYTVVTPATKVTVNVALSAGSFKSRPLFASMQGLGDTQIQYHYDYANSTATNLVFIGSLPSLTTIGNGTYPYSVMAVTQ